MDLLANDLSFHEQFHDIAGFREALSQLMAVRETAKRFGREIQCDRKILNTTPIAGMPMPQAIGSLGVESQRRAVMSWLTRAGPFWDDVRQHGENDWLECDGKIVTDAAVGEAAFRTLHGVECGLVSLAPSAWCFSPLQVTWVQDGEAHCNRNAEVGNWWTAETLEEALREQARPLSSWDDLREESRNRFTSLTFADDCFAPLEGIPFARSSGDRFLVLLDVLDRFARAFDDDGTRSAEGHRIYGDHFTGDCALFSGSSESEEREFRRELTFANPEDPTDSLFCPWHGKVARLTLRLHFSWPVVAGEPVYVVYAGPKITRR